MKIIHKHFYWYIYRINNYIYKIYNLITKIKKDFWNVETYKKLIKKLSLDFLQINIFFFVKIMVWCFSIWLNPTLYFFMFKVFYGYLLFILADDTRLCIIILLLLLSIIKYLLKNFLIFHLLNLYTFSQFSFLPFSAQYTHALTYIFIFFQ